jgi:hypothetical protein
MMKVVNLEYTDIPVLLPPIDFFIDKIKNDEPFHFLRVNHGIIDSIYYAYENNFSELENDILEKNYEKITKKIMKTYHGKSLGLKYHHPNETLLKKFLITFNELFIEYKNKSKKFQIGISLGIGLNTFWGVWQRDHHLQVGRTEFAKIIKKTIPHEFYYSGILKHYSIKREIHQLFDYINNEDYQVIFLGPEYLYLYEDVFGIKNFKHIIIPTTNAIEKFDENIEEILKIYQECGKKTIIFHSCGHILSFYLADKLKDTDIFGMDIGRSFDILIKDHLDNEPTMVECWTSLDETKLTEYVNKLRSPPMAKGIYKITEEFEEKLADYTGAKYVVTLDNMSNALFLALYYEHQVMNRTEEVITIPSRTYPSVPCEIIHAGLKVDFQPVPGTTLKGAYQLKGSNVWDSALRFTEGMYIPGSHMCISFTGPYKHFKLSKGGAILTDDYDAYCWFKRARYSGRREMSYHDDNFDMLGWNFYMMPELAARGLLLMTQFYYSDGTKKTNEDLELPYPDLSKFEIYRR